MTDLFKIGLSGLRAAQTQLSVTGQNISNINTPGYTRQTSVQVARDSSFTDAGYIGNGVNVVDVQRVYNQFLTNQVRASTTINADAVAFQSQVEELNSLLSGTATGIQPALQKVFAALQTAAEDPSSLPARQLVLAEASGLAARFNTVHERLATQNQFINQQIGTVTQQVNRLAASIASYNDSISKVGANGPQPNELFDARDEAVRKLSELIGVTVVPQDGNGLSIFIGSGQPLVVGDKASELRTAPSQDPARVDVRLVRGASEQGITGLISGGELGGLLRYRNEVLDPATNAMGRLAINIADQFNRQLSQGLDLNGLPGAGLYKDVNSPELVGLRSRSLNNDNQVDIHIRDAGSLTTSDYEVTFSSPTQFSVRRLSDNMFIAGEGIPPVFDGWELSIPDDQNIRAGDSFLVMPTRSGAAGLKVDMRDPKELAFASVPVQLQAGAENRGTASLTDLVVASPPGAKPKFDFLPLELAYQDAEKGFSLLAKDEVDAGLEIPNQQFDPRQQESESNPRWVSAPFVPVGQQFRIKVTDGDGAEHYFNLNSAGRPQPDDRLSIAADITGTGDNRNALKLAELQTASVLGKASGRGVSLLDSYGNEVQRVATLTAQARSESESSAAVLRQAVNNRDSVSAVNLDEEAANLIKFEQYYNASAQIIQVARSVFDTLISSLR